MNKEDRLKFLRNVIDQRGTISTSDLLELVDVSRMTLSRDLDTLQEQGFIERYHGSVTSIKSLYDLDASLVTQIDQKRCIAQEALQLIDEDDSVFLGAGTTVLEVAKAIETSGLSATVITNSLPIANTLKENSQIKLIITGGNYRSATRSFLGPVSLRSVEIMSARIQFFGANGFDVDGGITSHYVEHTDLIRRMMQSCRISVAVIDSSKFSTIAIHRICHLSEVDYIITDKNLDISIQNKLLERGVPLLVAEHDIPCIPYSHNRAQISS